LNEEIAKNSFKKYKNIANLTAGNFFGEISMLTKLPVTSTIVCTERSICGYISKENFDKFMENFPDT